MTANKSKFKFGWSLEAVTHNETILAQHNLNTNSAFYSEKGTTAAYRSKFWPVKELAPLLGHHK